MSALKKIYAALASKGSSDRDGPWPPGPEPSPLPGAAKTGGCRIPERALIGEAFVKREMDKRKKVHGFASFVHRVIELSEEDDKVDKTDRTAHDVDSLLSMRLAADMERPFGQSTGRGFSFTGFKVDHLEVIMRQRDVFAPWIEPDHSISLRTLQEVRHLVTHSDPICTHQRWEDDYPFLVPNLANLGLHRRSSEDETDIAPLTAEETAQIHPRLRCALLHKNGCECRDSIAFGFVKGCPRCYTDYAVHIVAKHASHLPGGRLLVFTTWKYLGTGSRYNLSWRTHQASGTLSQGYGTGHIRSQFEGDRCQERINIVELDQGITSVLESRRAAPPVYEGREEAPPTYTAAIAESGSSVIKMDKGK